MSEEVGKRKSLELPIPIDDVKMPAVLKETLVKRKIAELFPVQRAMVDALFSGTSGQISCNSRRDIAILSPTGSGKTLSYIIPLIMGIQTDLEVLQAIVVAPTRLLAAQVLEEMVKFLPRCNVSNGTNAHRAHALVLTPGKLVDLLPTLSPTHLRFLVFDEADRLMAESYFSWLRQLDGWLPAWADATPANRTRRQMRRIVVSATLTDAHVSRLGLRMHISVQPYGTGCQVPATIAESMVECEYDSEKLHALKAVLNEPDMKRVVIFVSQRDAVSRLAAELATTFPNAKDATRGLKSGDKSDMIIVTSDGLTRGIDFDSYHVVQYDAPTHQQTYVHRIGRTGRAYERGRAVTLATKKQMRGALGVIRKVSRTGEIAMRHWDSESMCVVDADKKA
ncbi:DEAD-box ATP-dependent RNA helicase 1-like isoform X1 [Carpediemonas membranifera]|uniref:ATP-dependent RNA helicase n=1 Tax=Carpediemonas membranifera TaxID=201153 RepID=A0A8J6AWU3_9EUKA|nr:DEAD-box ATP-dependent RNA helicase 1-like isoform X1 [Carpediemonas membranifera]|eukprot:KAG9396148.1 DEAD-box ATP-dependent RNA helicase 1-like isoform X1 [Carpediemonas membranifera]